MNQQNLIEAATLFVNTTDSHIFITGKAGTGKTTFLKSLAEKTHKNFLIVAPTGIAALNAGGVTIHSQFQLPLGTFLPDRTPSSEFSQENSLYTQYTLTRKHPISSLRKQVLRSIELLIIDEVSMLRADVLDAVDYRMRSVRGNFSKSFGGVQVLMIGDLYQLPPIVKDHEWSHLRKFYHSIHFFEAKALQTDGFVSIELEKIFRQSDDIFIQLLNNLRNNVTTHEDIALLNSYYRLPDVIKNERDVITITTHNYRADEINLNELRNLSGQSYFYDAQIDDDFPETIYPLPARLELKVGAQVMFVKNDVSGENNYFNGKLAIISSLEEESITVEMADTKVIYQLRRYEWENMRYTVNSSTRELDEEVIGTFSQFPIKLAWAVTVHKSQGLTFDKAIIDVGSAFAPGQVYVALSRLRSLDGLILRTRISTSVISSDEKVVAFSAQKMEKEKLAEALLEKQRFYVQTLLHNTFDFSSIQREIQHIRKGQAAEEEFKDDSMRNALEFILDSFIKEKTNTDKFRDQLMYLLQQNNANALTERLTKGRDYYTEILKSNIRHLLNHIEQIKQLGRKKGYLNELIEIDQLMTKKLNDMLRSSALIHAILNNTSVDHIKRNYDTSDRKSMQEEAGRFATNNPLKVSRKKPAKKKRSDSINKPDTVAQSVELFREKMSLGQIAEMRGLTIGTIETHLTKAVEMGLIDISEILTQEEINEITEAWKDSPEAGSKYIYEKLADKYSYGKIRAVRAVIDGLTL